MTNATKYDYAAKAIGTSTRHDAPLADVGASNGTVRLHLIIVTSTGKAYRVAREGTGHTGSPDVGGEVWVPASQVRVSRAGTYTHAMRGGKFYPVDLVEIPVWLYRKIYTQL